MRRDAPAPARHPSPEISRAAAARAQTIGRGVALNRAPGAGARLLAFGQFVGAPPLRLPCASLAPPLRLPCASLAPPLRPPSASLAPP
jgi:hypothetical protein